MKLYRYLGCALDNVYLESGYTRRTTPYGETVSIENVEGLHDAIARTLLDKPSPVNGKEFRFMRQHLKMSQKRIGDLFELTDQAIAKWEKEDNVPRYADALVRNLVREKLGGNAEVTKLLTQLAESERQEYLQRLEFSKAKNQDEWKFHQAKKRA